VHTLRRTGSISARELSAAIRDYVIIDVRDTDRWSEGHIPGSTCCRAEQLDNDWPDLDARLPIAVIASDNDRAEAAAARLRARGRDAVTLDGGHPAWIASGGCTVRSNRQPKT